MENRLTIVQLSKVLGISRRTIERELEKPDCNIPYNRIGRRKFFLLSEVLTATKCSPIDKRMVVNELELILDNDCRYGEEGTCIHDQIKDVIRFITKSDKEK